MIIHERKGLKNQPVRTLLGTESAIAERELSLDKYILSEAKL